MLEIIALIYLSGNIGRLAERKGLKKGIWQLYAVLAWFVAEFLGIFVAIAAFHVQELMAMLPFAYVFAVGGYLLVRYTLERKPDADQGFDFEKDSQDNHPSSGQ